ncbi:helix-turn-helix domain-containing protein [Motilimonas eburnea]|uniref:helix-turn-helix domain-containing protein n=1 Tax=Motilimonas eburnea TaxID=1737488 RepID=UPI001E29ADD0|nr:AraC family transcriptional regulator [Motilimonas eburnea]MCE2573661.1 AraC family transcriptional regulator [Motilimonas eburnea]
MDKNAKYMNFFQSSKVCLRQQGITPKLAWAQYGNAFDRLYYQNDEFHTLSLYIAGGEQTERLDIRAERGGPGKFCLMPQGSESRWQLGEPQQFMHLYFSDDHLKQLALKVFDIDPRQLALPDLTFFSHGALEAIYRQQIQQIDWSMPESHLAMAQLSDTILVNLLQSSGLTKSIAIVKGGLAPKVAKQVQDFMQANYHRQIYLHELAELAQLSEYHFTRMFKAHFARTPQEYLMQLRIEQVKHLLTGPMKLADIALACGFANQSHMGRYFKHLVGMTPSAYQKCLGVR